jgi:hypothetical protein
MPYKATAERLAALVSVKWNDRETLLDPFSERRWAQTLLTEAWANPQVKLTTQDWQYALTQATFTLDGNVWSQIYLASPLMIMPTYDVPKMQARLKALTELYQGKPESPFVKGAKMRREAGMETWDEALTLVAGLKVLEQSQSHTSYKMYNTNQTPAFSDAAGLSRMSSQLDTYAVIPRGTLSIRYPDSATTPNVTLVQGGANIEGFQGTFESKSGNWDNLCTALWLRDQMRVEFQAREGKVYMIPRFGSLSIIAP